MASNVVSLLSSDEDEQNLDDTMVVSIQRIYSTENQKSSTEVPRNPITNICGGLETYFRGLRRL